MNGRVFVLISYLVDENNEIMTNPVPLCATSSEELAKETLDNFKNKNSSRTMSFQKDIDRIFQVPAKEVDLEDIFSKVDFG